MILIQSLRKFFRRAVRRNKNYSVSDQEKTQVPKKDENSRLSMPEKTSRIVAQIDSLKQTTASGVDAQTCSICDAQRDSMKKTSDDITVCADCERTIRLAINRCARERKKDKENEKLDEVVENMASCEIVQCNVVENALETKSDRTKNKDLQVSLKNSSLDASNRVVLFETLEAAKDYFRDGTSYRSIRFSMQRASDAVPREMMFIVTTQSHWGSSDDPVRFLCSQIDFVDFVECASEPFCRKKALAYIKARPSRFGNFIGLIPTKFSDEFSLLDSCSGSRSDVSYGCNDWEHWLPKNHRALYRANAHLSHMRFRFADFAAEAMYELLVLRDRDCENVREIDERIDLDMIDTCDGTRGCTSLAFSSSTFIADVLRGSVQPKPPRLDLPITIRFSSGKSVVLNSNKESSLLSLFGAEFDALHFSKTPTPCTFESLRAEIADAKARVPQRGNCLRNDEKNALIGRLHWISFEQLMNNRRRARWFSGKYCFSSDPNCKGHLIPRCQVKEINKSVCAKECVGDKEKECDNEKDRDAAVNECDAETCESKEKERMRQHNYLFPKVEKPAKRSENYIVVNRGERRYYDANKRLLFVVEQAGSDPFLSKRSFVGGAADEKEEKENEEEGDLGASGDDRRKDGKQGTDTIRAVAYGAAETAHFSTPQTFTLRIDEEKGAENSKKASAVVEETWYFATNENEIGSCHSHHNFPCLGKSRIPLFTEKSCCKRDVCSTCANSSKWQDAELHQGDKGEEIKDAPDWRRMIVLCPRAIVTFVYNEIGSQKDGKGYYMSVTNFTYGPDKMRRQVNFFEFPLRFDSVMHDLLCVRGNMIVAYKKAVCFKRSGTISASALPKDTPATKCIVTLAIENSVIRTTEPLHGKCRTNRARVLCIEECGDDGKLLYTDASSSASASLAVPSAATRENESRKSRSKKKPSDDDDNDDTEDEKEAEKDENKLRKEKGEEEEQEEDALEQEETTKKAAEKEESKTIRHSSAWSIHDPSFRYEVGKDVFIANFADNDEQCAPGIHFFFNKEDALSYC